MRRKIHSVLLALAVAVVSATAIADGPSYRLEVDGLACPFCAYGIEKQLNRIEGVEQIETDIEAGTVIITMQEGHTLEQSRAEQAVDQAGFTLGGFERTDSAADDSAR